MRTIVVRLPQVHDTVKQGLVTYVSRSPARRVFRHTWATDSIAGLRSTSSMPPIFTGWRWRKAGPGARYHAVAEEGVTVREIAEAIGRGLKVPVVSLPPEKAAEHFGWLAAFAGLDLPASSAQTREKLGWNPTGPGLISDLENMQYFQA